MNLSNCSSGPSVGNYSTWCHHVFFVYLVHSPPLCHTHDTAKNINSRRPNFLLCRALRLPCYLNDRCSIVFTPGSRQKVEIIGLVKAPGGGSDTKTQVGFITQKLGDPLQSFLDKSDNRNEIERLWEVCTNQARGGHKSSALAASLRAYPIDVNLSANNALIYAASVTGGLVKVAEAVSKNV